MAAGAMAEGAAAAVASEDVAHEAREAAAAGPGGELEVRWMVTGNRACTIPASENMRISEVKELVHERAGVPLAEQHLFVGDQELASDAAAPAPGVAPLMLVRSASDPLVTDLGHFRAALAFPALPRGAFTSVRRLAAGINGDVFRFSWQRQGPAESVAVKKLRRERLEQVRGTETDERAVHMEPWSRAPLSEDALTEIGVLTHLAQQLDLPRYLLRMLGVFEEDQFVWLVTEFADGGELFDVAASGPVAEAKARQYTWQLLQAVAYLHRHHIGHRDISLENALLQDGVVKLMDFGMAVRSHSASGVTLRYFRAMGKETYRAPEVYVPATPRARVVAPSPCARGSVAMVRTGGYLCEVQLGEDAVPGQACMAEVWGYAVQPADVFAVGACLFMLAWQCPPWQRAMLADPMFAYVHGQGDGGVEALLRHWKKPLLSQEAMQLVSQMLRPDPAQRPSVASCLASPWFAGLADEPAGATAEPCALGGG